jgi:hypothetical protein
LRTAPRTFGELAQQLVAFLVAVTVVDLLEAVEVEEEYGAALAQAVGARSASGRACIRARRFGRPVRVSFSAIASIDANS